MGSSNIRDLLTAFSPSLDFFAISTGDGRIKVLHLLYLSVIIAVESGPSELNWVLVQLNNNVPLFFLVGF